MSSIITQSHAKINIALDVVSKRADGYHNVKMIMVQCGLCDTLTIEQTDSGIYISSNLHYLPTGEKNLAYKAADLFFKKTGINKGVKIKIQKRIPVAAGLAGGSSNAATVLDALNRLYKAGLSQNELMEMGSIIGADVPYCICGGTMLAEGIGDILTPLPPMPKTAIAIIKPNFSLSTASVYGNLKLEEIENHPDIEAVIKSIKNKDIKAVAENMGNILESVSIKLQPTIAEIKKSLIDEGALGSIMSGSGSSVFALFKDYQTAKKAASSYKDRCYTYAGWTK